MKRYYHLCFDAFQRSSIYFKDLLVKQYDYSQYYTCLST